MSGLCSWPCLVQADDTTESCLLGDADAEIPGETPKRKRKAKADPPEGSNTAKPKPQNAALFAGSPSHELVVWTEASMAAATEHLRKVDPSESLHVL